MRLFLDGNGFRTIINFPFPSAVDRHKAPSSAGLELAIEEKRSLIFVRPLSIDS
jgi:hypothetical protein